MMESFGGVEDYILGEVLKAAIVTKVKERKAEIMMKVKERREAGN